MLANSLLLNLASGALGTAGNAAANGIGAILGNGQQAQGNFTEFLNNANLDDLASSIPQEILDLVNPSEVEGEITDFLKQALTGQESITSLNEGEVATDNKEIILQILGGKNVSSNQNTDQVEPLVNNVTNPLTNNNSGVNGEKVLVNEDQSLNKISLNTQQELIKVDDERLISPLSKNLGLKEDERILGKDNLQNTVRTTENSFATNKSELLGLQNQVVGGQAKTITGGKEGANDLKLVDAFAEKQQSNDSNNLQSLVSHKNNADQFAKVDQFGREANTRYAQNQNLQQTQQDGNFRIVNFTKTNDGIELQLDPASMGKVQIKLETSAEGKVTLAIIAEKPETLESLKNDSSSIQKILDDNGMSSDSSSMSFNLQQGGGNQGNNGDGFKFNDSGRDIAFNLEQELNDNIKDVSISSTGALYRDLSGVGMLNIVV